MQTRSLGVEEELLVVDPRSWTATSRAREVLKEHAEHQTTGPLDGAADALDAELFRHQLETRTRPATDIGDLVAQVVSARRTASEAADARDLAVAACATIPAGVDEPEVTSDDRYRAMVETFGEAALLAPPAACTSTWRSSPRRRASAAWTGWPRGCRCSWR